MKDWKLYWIHMRPKTFLPSFVFVLTGYALNPYKANIALDLVWLFLVYSVLLFGGTCALNTHVDRDEGPLNFLENPPPRPKYLGHFGIFCMLVGCALGYTRGFYPFVCCIIALIISYLYSGRIPGIKWRGKEVGGVDVAIDAAGCGIIAIILGATCTGIEPTIRTWIIGWVFTFTVAGSYAATQIFQLKETDTYETARNYSSLLGAANALRVASVILIIGLGIIWWIIINDLKTSTVSGVQFGLYGIFTLLFFRGVYLCLSWAKAPFTDSTRLFKAVIFTLLGARLFWIAAEWIKFS